MSGWRVSAGWKLESTPGQEDVSKDFKFIGSAVDITYTPKNQWQTQYAIGSKMVDVAVPGRFSGDFQFNTILDYNNFEILLLGLEDYEFEPIEGTENGIHRFGISNLKRMRPFTLKFAKLNRIVGGTKDQTTTLLGCVVKSIKFDYSSSTSAIKININGSYMDESQSLADRETLDVYPHNEVLPVEWGCLQVGTLNEDGTMHYESVANNESTSFTIGRTISMLPTCGSRIDSDFSESQVQIIQVASTVYSRNPRQWYLRMYGYSEAEIDDMLASGTAFKPKRKNLHKIPALRITSFDAEEFPQSANWVQATFRNAFIDQMGQSYNSSSKIVDSPTIKVMGAQLEIKSATVNRPLL